MPVAMIFGSAKPSVQYRERRAAYVVITRDGKVALVTSGQKHFLPGGGSLPGEAPEATVVREVHEELALFLVLRLRVIDDPERLHLCH